MLLSIGFKPYHYQVPKSSILNEAKFLDPSLKTSPCTKTSRVSCENQSRSLLFRNVATFIESHCVFLLLFTVWWSIFDQPFRRLLPLSCFYGSSQWLLKVKITCKRVNFIKKWNQIRQFMSLISYRSFLLWSIRVLPINFGKMKFLKNWENVSPLAFPIQPGCIGVCEPRGRV